MQTTLLGLAIAFIVALIAALVGPYFIDWNQFRPQFEAEASQIIGARVRVLGELDARLLPAPSLRLRSVTVGGAGDLGKIRAAKLDVEFSLGSLMRGEWRATDLGIDGMAVDLGLDQRGRIDWPAATGKFNLGSLSIDRLNLTGRIALHDAASRSTIELKDIAFSGDVRSLAGSVRGDGSVMVLGARYPFRISSGQTPDNAGTRLHLTVDPGERPLAIDIEGLLGFADRVPRFEGAIMLATTAPAKPRDGAPTPWRITAKIKTDPLSARLEQIEANYGAEDRALKFTGLGDVRFGSQPLLHVALSARQLDADRLLDKSDTNKAGGKGTAADAVGWMPALRAAMTALPGPKLATQIEFAAEQIMLGGRPIQNLTANLQGDPAGWVIYKMDFRAPGTTHVVFTGSGAAVDSLAGGLEVESSDPDVLVSWLQNRTDVAYRNQRLLRLRGNVRIGADRAAIETLKAEIDGGVVEGGLALSHPSAGGSRFDATLKADRLDLDSASTFARAVAGPQSDWPDQVQVSLDVGQAISSGRTLSPFAASFGYDAKSLSLSHVKLADANGVTLEGAGNFDRVGSTGKLRLDATAASSGQISALVAPVAPSLASRLTALGPKPGPARASLALDLGPDKAVAADRVAARAVFEIETPQFKGSGRLSAEPKVASLRGFDVADIGRSELSLDTKLTADEGRALLAMLGLDRAIAPGEGPARFEATASGVWNAPLRVSARLSSAALEAEVQGTAEPWAADAAANLGLRVRRINFAPLFGLKPSNGQAQSLGLSSRVSLVGNRLQFDDIDGSATGPRLRGHLAVTLGAESSLEGDLNLDTIDLAPAFLLAIGAADRDAAEPLGPGLLKAWRGRVAFQARRGTLPGGSELRPIAGVLASDGQSLSFDSLKGGLGGGEVTATVDVRPAANGLNLNGSVDFTNVDGSVLRYRSLKMPAGRASLQMTLASQGRSVSALAGAVSGSGTVTLQSAVLAGFDPRAFEVAIRASDSGQATDDTKLRQIVEPVLAGGGLPVAVAQIPFTIRDARLRVGATTLDAEAARIIVSGGYDITADQVDIRATLTSNTIGYASSRPEIQLFMAGSPDALTRTLDVAALSSWLAVRAIDRETRRLDSLERGEPPPPLPSPNSPAPPALPAPATAAPPSPLTIAPLPAPIEIRPAPGAAMKMRPRPPLALSPQGNP